MPVLLSRNYGGLFRVSAFSSQPFRPEPFPILAHGFLFELSMHSSSAMARLFEQLRCFLFRPVINLVAICRIRLAGRIGL